VGFGSVDWLSNPVFSSMWSVSTSTPRTLSSSTDLTPHLDNALNNLERERERRRGDGEVGVQSSDDGEEDEGEGEEGSSKDRGYGECGGAVGGRFGDQPWTWIDAGVLDSLSTIQGTTIFLSSSPSLVTEGSSYAGHVDDLVGLAG
jgi:hypothetical protein